MKATVRYKWVFYGTVKTLQVKCPKCKLWQFVSPKCDTCEAPIDSYDRKEATEYRSEPPTWRDRIPVGIKEQVLQRDEYICQYCGTHCFDTYVQDPKSVTLDHFFPRSAGGRNDIDNLITSCRDCNLHKGQKLFDSFEDARDYILKHKHHD